MSNSFVAPWTVALQATAWDFLDKNTRRGCRFLLQGIFRTQGLNPHLLHWQVASLPLSHQGSPVTIFLIPAIPVGVKWCLTMDFLKIFYFIYLYLSVRFHLQHTGSVALWQVGA